MLFNSIEFLIFFPIVTYIYFLLPPKLQPLLLFIASCLFYMAFIPSYLLILFIVIAIDYSAAIIMCNVSRERKKIVLTLSIFSNLFLLAIFKYYDFFIDNTHYLLSSVGLNFTPSQLGLILPIGLSFHTFQAMSYTIEVYRGNQQAERNLLIYSLYVLFFPQLVAGPIERPQNLLPQLKKVHYFDFDRVSSGLRLMLVGFLKKILIADRLAVLVDQIYSNPANYGGPALILAIYFFSFQIYCDFSGYSDIAIGAGRVLGIDLMKNFKRPYFSTSLIDFWRRWHISLSSWFRDYLYIPLGGNRYSPLNWCFNIFIVFILSGFWHGAKWTFVAWGLLHGLFLVFSELICNLKIFQLKKCAILKALVTFHIVSFLWIFFRADSFNDIGYILTHIFDLSRGFQVKELGLNIFEIFIAVISIIGLISFEYLGDEKSTEEKFLKLSQGNRIAIYYIAVTILLVFGKFSRQQFVYFQF